MGCFCFLHLIAKHLSLRYCFLMAEFGHPSDVPHSPSPHPRPESGKTGFESPVRVQFPLISLRDGTNSCSHGLLLGPGSPSPPRCSLRGHWCVPPALSPAEGPEKTRLTFFICTSFAVLYTVVSIHQQASSLSPDSVNEMLLEAEGCAGLSSAGRAA